jgi:hypothetical protein
MSRGGRWRLAMSVARTAAAVGFAGALAWGGWVVASSLRQNSSRMPAAAKAVPIRPPELTTTRDGVLDNAWLARTLALRPNISLMELDLEKLRARVLADRQILTANLTRQFPDRLLVQVTERSPLARLRVEEAGHARDLLVAQDGVVFAGSGFDPAMVETLPWLSGIALVPEDNGFRPLPRMDVISRFLTDAQFAAEHLYRSWQIVSLARLESDGEIEVITKDNTTVVFNAREPFFTQLANLDFMVDKLAALPRARARIDLSLGREVPVMLEPLGTSADAKDAAAWRAAPAANNFLLRVPLSSAAKSP